jgi:hypothetical protein
MRDARSALTRLFRDQHGLVLRDQVLRLGFSARQIQYRLATGEWQQVLPGVYRSSASPATFEQRLLAACFAAGPRSVASHASAAWLWGLVERPPERPSLTVPTGPIHGSGAWSCTVWAILIRAGSATAGAFRAQNPFGPW